MADDRIAPGEPREGASPLHFLYVADPMCSWCYGFAPVVTAVARHFDGRIPVDVLMGGLRAGNTRAMRAEDKAYIRDAWTRVAAATGQPFDHAFFDREGFVYDTEPACRAVVTMRRRNPALALAMKSAVSRAFYAEGRDTTDGGVLADVAAALGEARDAFSADMASAEARNETQRDFLIAQQAGVTGFPCLLLGRPGAGYAMVTNGYRPLDGMIEGIEAWLDRKAA